MSVLVRDCNNGWLLHCFLFTGVGPSRRHTVNVRITKDSFLEDLAGALRDLPHRQADEKRKWAGSTRECPYLGRSWSAIVTWVLLI
jgi:hypothetical protein